MIASRRARAWVSLALGGSVVLSGACGSTSADGTAVRTVARTEQPRTGASTPAEASPDAGQTPSTTTPSDAAAPPVAACVAASSALEPRTIVGSVLSRQAAEEQHGRFEAEVRSVDVVPVRDEVVEWRILLRGGTGADGTVTVSAPRTLTPPFFHGQQVRASVLGSGGGPNRRYRLVFETADGVLLLAVNQAPSDWQVERGRPAGSERAPAYTERRYGVRFEHAGARTDVASGAWSMVEVDGCAYYLWGSAAERQLRPGMLAMPDYVGGWLDFAILRAVR